MGMSGGGGGPRAPLSEINVTPLVDVMLVLLVIFMVTAPILTTGIEVDLPRADAPHMPLEEEKLLLVIDRDQHIFLRQMGGSSSSERNEIALENLTTTLGTNVLLQQTRELYVQADENVPYGFVAQVLALVRQAGVEKLGLVTDPTGHVDAEAAEAARPPTQ
jgi:biopolymer transport protein TolR